MSSDDRYQRVNLRIPRDLHAQVMEAADARSHSMNAEIVQRLEVSFSPYSPISAIMYGMGEASAVERQILGLWRQLSEEDQFLLLRSAERFARDTKHSRS